MTTLFAAFLSGWFATSAVTWMLFDDELELRWFVSIVVGFSWPVSIPICLALTVREQAKP